MDGKKTKRQETKKINIVYVTVQYRESHPPFENKVFTTTFLQWLHLGEFESQISLTWEHDLESP